VYIYLFFPRCLWIKKMSNIQLHCTSRISFIDRSSVVSLSISILDWDLCL
jgi:hypothetical protein